MYPRPAHPAGGVFVHEQVRALRQRGIDARVLSGEPFWISARRPRALISQLRRYFRIRPDWTTYDEVPVLFFPYVVGGWCVPSLHAFTYSNGLRRVIGDVSERFPFEIVHAHTSFLDGRAGVTAARFRSVPLVITEHTGPFTMLTDGAVKRFVTRRAIMAADTVLAVSRALRRVMLDELLIPGGHISVLPNGFDDAVFHFPLPAPPRSKAPSIKALWVGHFVPVKRIDRLIEAFARVADQNPSLRLTLMGDGEVKTEVLADIAARGLSARILLSPAGDRAKVAEALRDHDFLVIASETETFSLVTIESFACGRPVLSTRCGGPEDLITDESLGILVSNNVDGLETGLLQMSSRNGTFNSEHIASHARAHYSWRLVAGQLAQVYAAQLRKPAFKRSRVPSERVLMITTDHLMIDRRILLEAKSLRAGGYEVILLAGFECPVAEQFLLEGLPVYRFRYDWSDPRVQRLLGHIKLPARLRPLASRALRWLVRKTTGFSSFEHNVLQKILSFDYDILHCHDFPLLKVAVEAARRRPTPLVYDAHELYHAQAQLPPATQKRYRELERKLIGRADLAITVNPFIADIMAKDYGVAPPHVIFNAAERRPRPKRDMLRQRLGIPPTDRVVLYQGWISEGRGLDCLIRCAQYFAPDIHLVVVGYGAYEARLREIAAEIDADDGRVFFLGQVDNAALAELTPFADLGVIPYHSLDANNRFCSPNKLFEYLAAGVPFVANDLPFLRCIATAFDCGLLIDLQSPQLAAMAIVGILRDGARLTQLHQAASRAADTLNWQVEGGKLLSLYEQHIKVRRSASEQFQSEMSA
jgi:glycosyltransferase involved in cell wall biosynthesis